ncbi:uncharacterized protein LOC101454187 isoform X1 [Ceratitis capitata]|uniref:uncharacterized protein LOC101454187 isoform X1 n=2 Tax=Ceratitis capitata TaxID=7213 RepID=UPI0006188363|nr:uncharacterized protein LOC101454187 isoform X1 [Ceratitis capitata]
MKFSCAIFFFAFTIALQLQRLHASPSDELFDFKRTLDEASNALRNVEESPALRGNAESQRQRRKSIDELLQNSKVDLRLNMQREALNSDHGLLQSLDVRPARNDYKNNKNEMSKKFNVNDQLNDLVRANSNFQNIHRKLLNTFHNSQTKLRMDDALQRERSSESKGSKANSGSSDSGSSKEDKEKHTNKDKEPNHSYNNANKNSQSNKDYKTGGGGAISKDDTYNSNYNYNENKDGNNNWKSSLSSKDDFNVDFDFGKSDSLSPPRPQSFSKFDAIDNFNSNTNFEGGKSGHKNSASGSTIFSKAFISCKPISKSADNSLGEKTYLEFTSNLHSPSPNKVQPGKGNLNTLLLLEANRNLHPKSMDNLEELNEKKVDPKMRKMMEKVDFPHLKLDFDSQMEDFSRSKSRSEYEDDDEPISYEKTIENIHFPSIVNDQFDLGRNDLSHEADYKLSKIEQEQSEPRRSRPLVSESGHELLSMGNKLNIPWKRSAGFNAMDEIKLKTSTRLMAKGLGPSLPSYALSETQHELQLDEAVKKLEQNIAVPRQSEIGELIDSNEYNRPKLRISEEQRDWQERLNRMEAAEERTYEKLLYESEVETPSAENDPKGKTDDDVIIKPTYSILRRRRKSEPSNENGESKLSASACPKRVSKDQHENIEEVLRHVSEISPEDILVMQIPDLFPVDHDEPATANEVPAPEVPAADELSQDDAVADVIDTEKVKEVEDAQLVEDSEESEEQSSDSQVSKRCGEQDVGSKNNDEKGTRDKDNDVKNDMTIFKFKREADNMQGSNNPKRRVKRIDVNNPDREFSDVKEVDLGGLMDFMMVRKLKPKREAKEKEDVGAANGKRAQRTSDGEKMVELSKQKVLRRRRRDVAMANPEVFNDDSPNALDGTERTRQSLNEEGELRMRREADNGEDSKEKKEKEKSKENYEAKASKPIDDEKDNEKKLTVSEEKTANTVEHAMDKRYAHAVDTIDDNSGDARKLLNAASMMGHARNSMQLGDSGDRALSQSHEALDDAAVIAADREAMNAARSAYSKNAGRAVNYIDGRDDKYGELIERLRRLPFQNRGHEQERETDLEKTVSEFGNQKFDNLKQSDQYARNLDGVPIDNLWYGHDPWDDDPDSSNAQAKNDEDEKNERKKNRPNQQHTALTINIEDGVIKSVERKESPSREIGVVNERMGNGEDEDYGAGEDPSLGWFSKGKGKESKDGKCKDEDDGMVLKLDDQLLNCTAFSTLESFLKSVQKNKDGDGKGGSGGNSKNRTETNSGRGEDNSSNKEGGAGGHFNDKKTSNNCAGDDGRSGQTGSGGGVHGTGSGGNGENGSQGKSGQGGVGEDRNNSQRKPIGNEGNAEGRHGDTRKGGSNDGAKTGVGKETDVTMRPLGSDHESRKAMKLNITINASVMGDQKAKNFFGNGTFKVQSEDRERRGVAFPEFDQLQRYTRRRKCPKVKPTCDESTVNGKGALQIVKSMFNMAKCNPQMKSLWSVLKRNQQCMKKIPPPDNSFEKMQKDDVNHIEDMVAQAMEAISIIIDDQVQQRSCIPLPPELKIFYDQILEIYDSNSAEGVREKRDSIDAPFNDFSKEVRLIDPNRIEERASVVKKLLRQYEDLPFEDQQQMVGLRDDLMQDLDFLERVREEQMQKRKREPKIQQTQQDHQPQQGQHQQQVQREQQPSKEQVHQPEVPQLGKEGRDETVVDKEPDTDNDEQARRRREVLQQLEAEKEDDEALIKAYDLPFTPEYLRLVKASELMQEHEIRKDERNEEN